MRSPRPHRGERVRLGTADGFLPDSHVFGEPRTRERVTGDAEPQCVAAPTEEHRSADPQYQQGCAQRAIVASVEPDSTAHLLQCHGSAKWRGARRAAMDDIGNRCEVHLPPSLAKAPTKIGLFRIHEVALVKAADGLERASTNS